MEFMRRSLRSEQNQAVKRLSAECGKVVDIEARPYQDSEGKVYYEARWDDDERRYELESQTRVHPRNSLNPFGRQSGDTVYCLSVEVKATDETEFYCLWSGDNYVGVCDEEWDEVQGENDVDQLELCQKLSGYLASYQRSQNTEQQFRDIVMDFAMSGRQFRRGLKRARRWHDSDEQLIDKMMKRYPVLDESTVKRGLRRYGRSTKAGRGIMKQRGERYGRHQDTGE